MAPSLQKKCRRPCTEMVDHSMNHKFEGDKRLTCDFLGVILNLLATFEPGERLATFVTANAHCFES